MRPDFRLFFGVVSLLLVLMIVTLHLLGEAGNPLHSFLKAVQGMTLHRADSSKRWLPKETLAIAVVEDEHRATTLEDL